MSGKDYSAVKVLIPTGLGLNCELETAQVFRHFGAEPELVHLTDLFTHRHPRRISDYQVMAFMGGFAYGDHVAGGLVLATRMRAHLRKDLAEFLSRGGLAIGICNGFQTLVRLGLLPGPDEGEHDFLQRADLGPNDRMGYRNSWVRCQVDPNTRCLWTRGLDQLDMPARHGEGKFLLDPPETLDRLEERGQVALRYIDDEGQPTEKWPFNPNGSRNGIAGVTDSSGRVLGLMPHPEAFLHPWLHPRWRHEANPAAMAPTGVEIFRAGLDAALEIL